MYRKKPPPKPHDAILSSYRSFIRNSARDADGNSFKETIVSARRSNWATRNRLALVRPWTIIDEPRDDDVGAYSLGFYARRILNKYIGDLTVDVLQATPWEFAERIWLDARATGRDSFHVWATFATVFPEHVGDLTRDFQIPSAEPLASVIDTLAASSFVGIVYLDLRVAKTISSHDLLRLPALPNLHTLMVDGSIAALDDNIVRCWGRSGRMTKLEQLSLRDCEAVTKSALQYTSWLPRLMFLDLTGCSLFSGSTWSNDARENGWRFASSTTLESLEELGAEDLVLRIGIRFGISPELRGYKAGKARVFVRSEEDLEKAAVAAEKMSRPRPVGEKRAKSAKLNSKRKMDIGSLLDEFTARGPPKKR